MSLVVCGFEHTLTLDASGSVWGFGRNTNSQLGCKEKEDQVIPKKIESLVDITCVAAGNYHSLCCDVNGKVWSFGKNSLGCLGTPDDVDRPTPTVIEGLENIIYVSCGDIHSACLDSTSFAWTFGDNRDWKLGLPERKVYPPTRVDLENIKAVSCGADHTAFVTTDGKLYSTGANAYGQLGTEKIKDREKPTLQCVPNLPTIDSVACGTWYTVVLTSRGEVYSFGFNTNGQLGVGDKEHRNTPTKAILPDATEICRISCGYYHTMMLDTTDSLWLSGRNMDGQLGLGDSADRLTPEKLEHEKMNSVCHFSYGGCSTILKDSDTVIWVFGNNDHGQIGLGGRTRENTPKSLPEEFSSVIGKRSVAKSARN